MKIITVIFFYFLLSNTNMVNSQVISYKQLLNNPDFKKFNTLKPEDIKIACQLKIEFDTQTTYAVITFKNENEYDVYIDIAKIEGHLGEHYYLTVFWDHVWIGLNYMEDQLDFPVYYYKILKKNESVTTRISLDDKCMLREKGPYTIYYQADNYYSKNKYIYLKSNEVTFNIPYDNSSRYPKIDYNDTYIDIEYYSETKIKYSECTRLKCNDKSHGKWIDFYRNGQKKSETDFYDGLHHGKVIWWYEDGSKEAEFYYYRDQLHGLFTEWYKSGKLKSETNYSRGLLHGKAISWDEKGNVIREEIYEKENLIKKIK